jgi:polysaccharide deacetylase 2 family uncharacterized protein YibQ
MRQAGKQRVKSGWLVLPLLFYSLLLVAGEQPVISLIIDDLGYDWEAAHRAVNLPGQLTYAILPQTPYAVEIARMVHNHGKEVMLHQPMQPITVRALGPGGLTLDMDRKEFLRILRQNLESIPHVRGINNHMGSLLTRDPEHMRWLMHELKNRNGLYLVDSRTTEESVMPALARETGLQAIAGRDIFLDYWREPEVIRKQFSKGVERARSHGSAILIGHPYPETLDLLQAMLPTLKKMGVKLVPASETVHFQKIKREQLWQASLSHSQKDVKSLKQ